MQDIPVCMLLIEDGNISEISNTLKKELDTYNINYSRIYNTPIKNIIPEYYDDMYRVKSIVEFKTRIINCCISSKDNIVYLEFLHGTMGFITYVGHSFNNPVSSSVELINLLNSKGALTDNQKVYIKRIKQNNLELTRNINNIIDYLKIISSENTVKKSHFSIKECFDTLEKIIKKENVHITYDSGGYYILSDKDKFIELLGHVITHCSKSLKVGHISIKSKLKRNTLTIYISDTGDKISRGDMDGLFVGFVSDNYKINSSGLELPIARGLARSIGGDLILSRTSDTGNIYKFTLSLEDSSSCSSSSSVD